MLLSVYLHLLETHLTWNLISLHALACEASYSQWMKFILSCTSIYVWYELGVFETGTQTRCSTKFCSLSPSLRCLFCLWITSYPFVSGCSDHSHYCQPLPPDQDALEHSFTLRVHAVYDAFVSVWLHRIHYVIMKFPAKCSLATTWICSFSCVGIQSVMKEMVNSDMVWYRKWSGCWATGLKLSFVEYCVLICWTDWNYSAKPDNCTRKERRCVDVSINKPCVC